MKQVRTEQDEAAKAQADELRQVSMGGAGGAASNRSKKRALTQQVSAEQAETNRIAEQRLEKERALVRDKARAAAQPYKYRRALVFGQNVGPAVPATPMFAAEGYALHVATRHVPLVTIQSIMGYDAHMLPADPPTDGEGLVARIKAGGHAPEITARKAIQEAFSCLFLD